MSDVKHIGGNDTPTPNMGTMRAMRHASIATTMIYAAVDADRIVDAVAALPWAA